VAAWNLSARHLSGNTETGLSVGSEPLGFYHFTGFDSGAHLGMAKKYRSSPAVLDLLKWYGRQTEKLGRDPIARARWAYDTFSNGEKITPVQRIVYRQRVDLQAAFPDPFDVSGYLQWWRTDAPKEHPELFDRAKAGDALRRLTSPLTPGGSQVLLVQNT